MKRNTVLRHVTLGALATGLVPLTAAGAGARSTGDSALCRSTFGDWGPTGGRIVGEGPSGDPMAVNIGWDPADWPGGGLDRIVTCVSVDGHAVPALTTSTASPPNAGGLTLTLTLPAGEPGSLVCEQSVLVGGAGAEGRNRTTSPVCFKLRAADAPPPTRAGGRTSDAAPAPASPAADSLAGPPARTPNGPGPAGPPSPVASGAPGPRTRTRMGSPDPASSTPPARAAFEAASAAAAPRGRPAAVAIPKAASAPTPAVIPSARPTAGAPTTALPRTGLDDHLPLAGAGGLLALGGLAIVLAEPRRRTRLRPGA
ncbi:MAG: hypothetical protein QOJ23_4335 [Actinomycetota bacterium]|nr:hypothetical protein [Actinomycetota bacterium]